MKKIILALLSLCVLLPAFAKPDADIEKLRKQFQAEALSQPVNIEQVQRLMDSLRPDGTWPGIDYVDTSRIAFQHVRHLDNLVSMALAYKQEGSPLRKNKTLKKKFDLALNHWLDLVAKQPGKTYQFN